jgi:hypothetical protein
MTTPTPEVYEFDAAAIQGALEAAKEAAAEQVQVASEDPTALDLTAGQASEVTIQAACISVTVRNRRVCVSLPFGFGQACLPIPISIGDGTSAQACLDVRTIFGIPTGVCVSVHRPRRSADVKVRVDHVGTFRVRLPQIRTLGHRGGLSMPTCTRNARPCARSVPS